MGAVTGDEKKTVKDFPIARNPGELEYAQWLSTSLSASLRATVLSFSSAM